jgi:DNA polymerase III subunit gamma/tau
MDNYIVSARKYRPDSFESVVGQDSITRTLKNSVKAKQVAQAYLFCGPRGVGKTTCARIYAKTINCSNLTPEYEACNQCESCVSFNKLRSLNIHELDAASNNSVDDIRNLIEQVRIPPQIGSYSIYIIDEVHMLSSQAFNAFLKTLEEPPKHVVFILATTEKHKIIPTILSRCQIFDFNRIQIDDITKRLEFVAKKEGITAEHDALQIIAQKADGAMRDALSIFDQIVSFSGNEISYKQTISILNVLDYDYYFRITDAFLKADYPEVLTIYNEILFKGFEGTYFISGLSSHFRDLLMCKVPKTVGLIEVGKSIREEYMKYSLNCSVPFIFKALNIANECELKYKQSQSKRLLVELSLLKICQLTDPAQFSMKYDYIPKDQRDDAENIEAREPAADNKQKTETEQRKPEIKAIKPNEKETQPVAEDPKQISEEPNKSEEQAQKTNEEHKTDTKSTGNIGYGLNKGKDVIKSISITQMAEENEKTQASKNEESEIIYEHGVTETESFDEEKLKYVWTKYAETKRSENYRLFVYLNQHIPVIKDENKIVLEVDNNDIKKKLDLLKAGIENFIIKELNNKDASLHFELKAEDNNNKLSSDEEKLNNLIEKNPEIKNLKDQLNLDFM